MAHISALSFFGVPLISILFDHFCMQKLLLSFSVNL